MDIKLPKTKTYLPTVEVVGDESQQVKLTYEVSFNDTDLSKFFNNSHEMQEYGPEEGFDEWRTNFAKDEMSKFFLEKFKSLIQTSEESIAAIEVDVALYGDHADAMWGDVNFYIWIDLPIGRYKETVDLVFEDLKS